MTKYEEVQRSIERLSPEEIARLRAWLDELEDRAFDEKVARDVENGKLDKVLAEVKANISAGRGEDF